MMHMKIYEERWKTNAFYLISFLLIALFKIHTLLYNRRHRQVASSVIYVSVVYIRKRAKYPPDTMINVLNFKQQLVVLQLE